MRRYNVDIQCGTHNGYQLHYRRKEPACEPCKTAAYEYIKQKQKNNPKRRAAKNRQKSRRRAKQRGNGYEKYSLEQVLELYGTNCHICNTLINFDAPRNCTGDSWELGLHIDHVIAIANGGPDTLENVRPAHAMCNVRKNAKEAPHPEGRRAVASQSNFT
jgi:hypothetical protein